MNRHHIAICLSLFFTLAAIDAIAQENTIKSSRLDTTAEKLFEWPTQEVISNNQKPDNIPEIRSAKRQSRQWLERFIDASWLPDKDAAFMFIQEEFDGRDTVRIRWIKQPYNLEVSQTKGVLTLMATQVDSVSGDIDKEKRQGIVLDFSRKILARTAKQQQGKDVVTVNTGTIIEERSFLYDAIWDNSKKCLSSAPRLMRDDQGLALTPCYWYETVHWWHNGASIGFYLYKLVGNSPRADVAVGQFDAKMFDGNWFLRPKKQDLNLKEISIE